MQSPNLCNLHSAISRNLPQESLLWSVTAGVGLPISNSFLVSFTGDIGLCNLPGLRSLSGAGASKGPEVEED